MKSKTKTAKVSVDIDRKIGAFTERLGASLRAMISERLEATLSYVHDAVIGSMTAPLVPSPPLTVDSLLEAETQTQPTRPIARAKRKARAGAADSSPVIEISEPSESPDSGATEREPRKRAQMACRKCGEIGFRADGCGRTHNVRTNGAAPSSGKRWSGPLARTRAARAAIDAGIEE